MAAFKKGDVVTVKVVVPSGPITALRMDEDGVVSYLVQWTDINGVEQQRWFTDAELVTE